MTTLYVDYCARTKLSCAGQVNPAVVLCLRDEALIAPTECPEDSELTYVGAYAVANLCQFYSNGDGCSPTTWCYRFSYDSEILADENTPLQPADIIGVMCEDCLTSYFRYLLGDEVSVRTEEDETQTLITQHGCEYPLLGSGGGGGGCSNVFGQDVLASTFFVTDTTFENVGISITLPSAGSYLVTTTLIWSGSQTEGLPVEGWFRLFDDTAGSAIPFSEDSQGPTDVPECYSKTQVITVTEATILQVQSHVTLDGDIVTVFSGDGGGGAAGEGTSLITYFKLDCEGGGEGGVPFVVSDTDSVDLTVNPDLPQVLSADVEISADAGNAIEVRADGLYAEVGGGGVSVYDQSILDVNTTLPDYAGPGPAAIGLSINLPSAGTYLITVNLNYQIGVAIGTPWSLYATLYDVTLAAAIVESAAYLGGGPGQLADATDNIIGSYSDTIVYTVAGPTTIEVQGAYFDAPNTSAFFLSTDILTYEMPSKLTYLKVA